jgi:hypothetical protein
MHVAEFIAELARNQSHVERLLAIHLPDERDRCAACALDPRLRPRWPCGPQAFAAQARRIAHLTPGVAA